MMLNDCLVRLFLKCENIQLPKQALQILPEETIHIFKCHCVVNTLLLL